MYNPFITYFYNLQKDHTNNSSTHLTPYIVFTVLLTILPIVNISCILHAYDYSVPTNLYFLIHFTLFWLMKGFRGTLYFQIGGKRVYSSTPSLRPRRAEGTNSSVSWRQEDTDVLATRQSDRQKNSLLTQTFLVSMPSMEWVRPIHMGRVICFSQSTDSNVNLTQKHTHRHTQK